MKNIIVTILAVAVMSISAVNYFSGRVAVNKMHRMLMLAYKSGWYSGAVSQNAHLTDEAVMDAFSRDSTEYSKFLEP